MLHNFSYLRGVFFVSRITHPNEPLNIFLVGCIHLFMLVLDSVTIRLQTLFPVNKPSVFFPLRIVDTKTVLLNLVSCTAEVTALQTRLCPDNLTVL